MSAETTAPGRFRGHTAVVTGAARGIGAATAHRLAAEGARVVLTDIDDTGGQVAARIEAAGGQATFVAADVASDADWERVATVAHRYGPVDVLVSNAFFDPARPLHDTTRDSWDR